MRTPRNSILKFMDQGWSAVYYSWAFFTGLYIMSTEWGFSSSAWWNAYPYKDHTPQLKAYYLIQLSFWIHMMFVTVVEPKRSDFLAMMAHHIITAGLIGFSYGFNFVRVGTAILVEQDFADIWFPIAKMFRYAGWTRTCDALFATFALAWIPTRHGLFFYILWSCIFDPARLIPPASRAWDPARGLFYDPNVMNIFYVALFIFQGLMIFWLTHLLRAVWNALTKSGQIDDHRSDDDEEEEQPKKD